MMKITEVCKDCLKQKGFDSRGCYGTDCHDTCCRYGCDVDKDAYYLIRKNSDVIKDILDLDFRNLFSGKMQYDSEYPGGAYIRSRKLRATGYCIFHKVGEKGCVLYELVFAGGLPKSIIPLICRLYPIEWDKGKLRVDRLEESSCNIFSDDNNSAQNILESQKETLDEYFEY
jgi:hypothetical protein